MNKNLEQGLRVGSTLSFAASIVGMLAIAVTPSPVEEDSSTLWMQPLEKTDVGLQEFAQSNLKVSSATFPDKVEGRSKPTWLSSATTTDEVNPFVEELATSWQPSSFSGATESCSGTRSPVPVVSSDALTLTDGLVSGVHDEIDTSEFASDCALQLTGMDWFYGESIN